MKAGIRTAGLAILVTLLIGCARYTAADPESYKDTLRPISANEYEFKVESSTLTPAESKTFEARRMAMLDRVMRQSGFCPSGYRVTSRTPVVKVKGILFGSTEDLYYRVKCK